MRTCTDDGKPRRYVLVQLQEPIDASLPQRNDILELGVSTIAEITRERARRAAAAIREEHPMFEGDLGFRVFKLDSSNIRAWEPDRENLEKTLADHMEHLKPGRSEADVLYELLLKLGLDLCVPVESRAFAGKDVHAVGGGVLLACLAEAIAADEVEALGQGIVEWRDALAPAGDVTCVFRDGAFADDRAKLNLVEILVQGGFAEKSIKSI